MSGIGAPMAKASVDNTRDSDKPIQGDTRVGSVASSIGARRRSGLDGARANDSKLCLRASEANCKCAHKQILPCVYFMLYCARTRPTGN